MLLLIQFPIPTSIHTTQVTRPNGAVLSFTKELMFDIIICAELSRATIILPIIDFFHTYQGETL
uniref:Uncharacterized protein n=1 Tax=Octopus bimaculoides TaxID=37653 RepID=A0A0L8FQI2_OCTBM